MTETNGKNDQVIITRDHLYRFRRTLVALGAVFEGGCNGGGLGCERAKLLAASGPLSESTKNESLKRFRNLTGTVDLGKTK